MKRLILALSLGSLALSGCAQLKEWYYSGNNGNNGNPTAGATGAEEQSPFPSHFKNDHYYQP
jgi:hypothetical protein